MSLCVRVCICANWFSIFVQNGNYNWKKYYPEGIVLPVFTRYHFRASEPTHTQDTHVSRQQQSTYVCNLSFIPTTQSSPTADVTQTIFMCEKRRNRTKRDNTSRKEVNHILIENTTAFHCLDHSPVQFPILQSYQQMQILMWIQEPMHSLYDNVIHSQHQLLLCPDSKHMIWYSSFKSECMWLCD